MADPSTAPLSLNDKALIRKFNKAFEACVGAVFASGPLVQCSNSPVERGRHNPILSIIGSHSLPGVIGYTLNNLGSWGRVLPLNCASGNELIQYESIPSTAYYAHAFVESDSNSLFGQVKEADGYTLKFTAGELPTYTRFLSVTAYTVEEVEVIPGIENKYAVASYTSRCGLIGCLSSGLSQS